MLVLTNGCAGWTPNPAVANVAVFAPPGGGGALGKAGLALAFCVDSCGRLVGWNRRAAVSI